jgi:hypothetical protein
MDLKNAVSVCLISLFSATLVVLIARVLDSQAASRLEPQLARIVDELQAIRRSGGITAASGGTAENETVDDGLMVYYFHSDDRCPTCRAIETQSHDTVHSLFAPQLDSGELIWKILNYEQPAGTELAERFEIHMPMVVLARIKAGQIEDWKSLDQVWALVGDEPAFAEYVRDEIVQMLESTDEEPAATPHGHVPEIPLPDIDPSDAPDPTVPADIPLPQ